MKTIEKNLQEKTCRLWVECKPKTLAGLQCWPRVCVLKLACVILCAQVYVWAVGAGN